MDVLFINAQDALELRKEVNGQLILGTLLLQAGFDVDILRFCEIDGFKGDYELFIQNSIQKILSYEPKAVSFYSLWPDYHIMLRIAKEIKVIRPDIYTVFGGPQPSATAQDTMEAMPYVDFICSGEGENTIVPFFKSLIQKNSIGLENIDGLFYRRNGIIITNPHNQSMCDLDSIPQWDERLFYKNYIDNHENYKSSKYNMCIDVGRGCPFRCTYCYSSIYWQRRYRLKSISKIISEIKYYNKKFGINSFFFTHDALTVNKKYITELCNQIIKEKLEISWKCTSRIDCLDHNLINLMISAGLRSIEMGIETGSNRMQKIINKNLNLDHSLNIIKHLISNKIRVSLFFMYGFPNETTEDIEKTLNYIFNAIDIGAHAESMTMCRFSPGTKLTTEYIDQLEYCTSVPELANRSFGVEQETVIIKTNKTIFSYLYHLNTPLRNNFSYLHYFIRAFSKYPKTTKYLRQIYNCCDTKLYSDFLIANANELSNNYINLANFIESNNNKLLLNVIESNKSPYKVIIKDILEYEFNIECLSKEHDIFQISKSYNFNYYDLIQQIRIDQFKNQHSLIMFTNIPCKLCMSIIEIK